MVTINGLKNIVDRMVPTNGNNDVVVMIDGKHYYRVNSVENHEGALVLNISQYNKEDNE